MENMLISPNDSIRDAVQKIDLSGQKIVFVSDFNNHLLGSFSDGDIRRALLAGAKLEDELHNYINRKPIFAKLEESVESLNITMELLSLTAIPRVDETGKVVEIVLREPAKFQKLENVTALLMAGGKGTRLFPLTAHVPKPLVKLHNRTLIEIILSKFYIDGIRDVLISIHHMAEEIIDFVGDGSHFGLNIKYLHENEPLGTLGALGLVDPNSTNQYLLVCNSDVVFEDSISSIVENHVKQNVLATICSRVFESRVQFGRLILENGRLISFEEKPVDKFYVNTGIYVFDKSILDFAPKGEFMDAPTFFEMLIERQIEIGSYEIEGYWLDVGTPESLEIAEKTSWKAVKFDL